MKKNLFKTVILFAVLFFMLVSCKKENKTEITIKPDIELSGTDAGKVIAIKKGQVISITLPNPADGGFDFTDWLYDKTVLHLDNHIHTPPPQTNPPTYGDGGKDTWQFTVSGSGTTDFQISAARLSGETVNIFKCTIKAE